MSQLLCMLAIPIACLPFGLIAVSFLARHGRQRPWLLWLANVAVGALVGAVVVLVGSARQDLRGIEFFAVMVPVVLGFLHVWTYVGALRVESGPWPTEPCLDSGSWLGAHWFAFESEPGRQCWTVDPARALAIRERPAAELDGAFEVVVQGGYDSFVRSQVPAMGDALLGGLLAFLAGDAVAWLVGTTLASRPYPMSDVAVGVGITSVLAAPLQLMAAFVTFAVAWFVSNRLMRPRRPDLVWQGSVLFVDGRAFHLDDPTLQANLTWEPRGAVLDLITSSASLRVPGRHRDLAALHRAIVERERSTVEDAERARDAVRGVLDRT